MRTDSPEFRNLVKSIQSSSLKLPPLPGKPKLPEIISFTGIKDTDREILSKLNDADTLRACSVNKKFWNEICDDQFFRRRFLKYPGLESMKNENETWKQFFLRYMKYTSLMKEKYNFEFDYRYPDFQHQYTLLRKEIRIKNKREYERLSQEAVFRGHFSLAKYAIERGNLKPGSIFFQRVINDMEMVRYLIENGKIENFTSEWVSGINNLEVLKYLSKLYHFDAEDYTKILSNNIDSLEIVKYLVENGADINYNDRESLRSAIYNDNFEIVKFLVEKGADVNANRVLELAAENGNYEIVKFLVENGAAKEAKNDALLKGIRSFEMVKYLVENGADNINLALIEASGQRKGYETVKYLVEKGADIHYENDSALNSAIYSRDVKTIKYLIAKAYENGTLVI
jgi:hypothetical protein